MLPEDCIRIEIFCAIETARKLLEPHDDVSKKNAIMSMVDMGWLNFDQARALMVIYDLAAV